jgi:hypothetical protein
MMKKTFLFVTLILGLLALTGGLILKTQRDAPPARAATTALAGSLQAGCYLITPTACRLSVEPFSIHIAEAERLLAFKLTANGELLYDFGASASDSITGVYTPAPPALDFAIRCGQTYEVELHALDSGDLNFVTVGQTQPLLCPSATFHLYLPAIKR